ncbi:hypothetical protein [Persicitalea sp.]|uniref:hypothetical protein n=1 Tax=Persicitalea sp. TaxID=3100273 RepID=UPI0035932832
MKNTLRKKLIIENGTGAFWGRVYHEDNLLVDEAESVEKLQTQMRQLLLDFHDLAPEFIRVRDRVPVGRT